jgi:ectoine hydroxylase-related dioxygenase (phytanoyl-CoA dioxygenase family)
MDAVSQVSTQKAYIQQFQAEGVTVLRKQITVPQLKALQAEINKIREEVLKKIEKLPRPLRTYSDIAERYLGRLDLRCGFRGAIFDEVAEPISKLIQELSPLVDFRYYWGAIPSLGGSGPTNMHRDVYPILNNTLGEDLCPLDLVLPTYYVTVLIPLVEITRENGPTEFIKGSNRRLVVDPNQEEIFAPLLSPGDFVLFDGRTLHKGSANNSEEERLVAYITFAAKWYHDQTFGVNDYLLPELSVRGK